MKRRRPELEPATYEEVVATETTWREGWAREFPDEPWPGIREAMRRIRAVVSDSKPPTEG